MRVQFIIGRYEGATPAVETAELERGISDIVRTWQDRLAEAIRPTARHAEDLLPKYSSAFSAGYAEHSRPASARGHPAHRAARTRSYRSRWISTAKPDAPAHRVRAAVYRFGGPINLSQRVPVLENIGFVGHRRTLLHVHPRFADGAREVTLHDMVLETARRRRHRPAQARQAAGGMLSRGVSWRSG